MRYRREIEVAAAAEPTFAYLSDFANAHEGGARVAYEADLRLKGVYRLAEPFFGSMFGRMGDAALDGLAARLARSG